MARVSGSFRPLCNRLLVFLAMINLMTSDYPWVIWPALGWGIGLAFHFWGALLSQMTALSGKWRNFAKHLVPYLFVIGMLGIINFMTTDYPWVIWPALGWGVGLAIHLWTTILSREQPEADEADDSLGEQLDRQRDMRRESVQKEAEALRFSDASIQAHLDKAYRYRDEIQSLINSSF